MSPTRREALTQLAALTAVDPLDGTIADFQAGLRRGNWNGSRCNGFSLVPWPR